MIPRVLVFQHVSYCPLGTLGEHLAADHIKPAIVELNKGAAVPNIEDFDILIVLGGQMEVWEEQDNPWLVPEKAAIRRWVQDYDKPILGVCLGHQMLADALGGQVGRAAIPEAGVTRHELNDKGRQHPLFAGFGSSKRAINWHGSEVKALPAGGVKLASTGDCSIAAFAVGSAAFGVQYHVEATDQLVNEWSDLPAGAELVTRLHGRDAVPRVRADVAAAMPELRANSRLFYDNFMDIARRRLAQV